MSKEDTSDLRVALTVGALVISGLLLGILLTNIAADDDFPCSPYPLPTKDIQK